MSRRSIALVAAMLCTHLTFPIAAWSCQPPSYDGRIKHPRKGTVGVHARVMMVYENAQDKKNAILKIEIMQSFGESAPKVGAWIYIEMGSCSYFPAAIFPRFKALIADRQDGLWSLVQLVEQQ